MQRTVKDQVINHMVLQPHEHGTIELVVVEVLQVLIAQ